MKLLSTLLLLAISCGLMVRTQTISNGKAESISDKSANSRAQLQLTTSIVEQKHYCSNFEGFKLRLTFKNTGSVPIILDKRSLKVGHTVSRDLEAAAAKQYEDYGRADLFGEGDYFKVDPSDMSNFVVIKPGEDYALDSSGISLWIDNKTPPQKGYLIPGAHILQIKVLTWTYFANAESFRKKWMDKGFLWYQEVTSLPMPFTIKIDPSLPNC